MNILVTGGAGYIGSQTVKVLIKKGHQVVVYDNLSNGHKEAVDSKAILVIGDLSDGKLLDNVFKKYAINAVMHFAGLIQVNESALNPGKYFYNNFCYGINLLEAMIKNKVKYIVFSSSAAVYGSPERVPIKESDARQPFNTYGVTKLMFEQALDCYEKAYNIKYRVLRYFNAAGASSSGLMGESHNPETHIIPLIIEVALGKKPSFPIFGNKYLTPDGTCVRDYIHVEDLADAHIASLDQLTVDNESGIYNLGSGKGFSNLEIVDAVKKVTGKNIKTVIKSNRAGDPAVLVADSSLARKNLHWQPKYQKIEDIIESAWKWHKNNPDGYRKDQ